MTTIAVVGATGYTGSNIAREAVARGHRVVGLSRSAPADPVDGVEYVVAPVAEADRVIAGADVVVSTLAARGDTAPVFVGLNAELAQQAAVAGARFIVIGGFMSTRPAPGEPRLIEGDVPEEYRVEAQAGFDAFTWLSRSAPADLDWLYVSPAGEYGSWVPGERTGSYRTSGDVSLVDEAGRSVIGGADFALAVVDEIDTPTVHRGQIHFAY